MASFAAMPAFPMAFWGTITLNGNPAPVNTVVRAYYGDILAGQVVVAEEGIYGYTESTKQKLVVKEEIGSLFFTFQTSSINEGSETSGCIGVSYSGFTSGLTVEKDLIFNTTNCGGGGGFVGQVMSTGSSQVTITNSTATANLLVNSDVTNPKIDASSFISGGTGTLPEINVTSNNTNNTTMAISASTVVSSTDTAWDGVIALPTVVNSVTLPETPGQTKTFVTGIEVGFTGGKLSFDKAVRILLVGQAGNRAGYVRTGTAFTEITAVCEADSQTAGNALAIDGECKIDTDVGSDLVIWTKHFTSFATYTQVATATSPSTGSSPSSSSPSPGGNGMPYSPTIKKKGDANSDNKVDIFDFNTLMINWGKTGSNLNDFNSDNKVDIFDFNLLMVNWGK